MIAAIIFMAMAGADAEPPRPTLECAEHMSDDRARRACLRDLLDDAETELAAAVARAGQEAEDVDLMAAGRHGAQSRLETAQSAWLAYRDAECERRASLMLIGADDRGEIDIDCRIAVTRARTSELLEQ